MTDISDLGAKSKQLLQDTQKLLDDLIQCAEADGLTGSVQHVRTYRATLDQTNAQSLDWLYHVEQAIDIVHSFIQHRQTGEHARTTITTALTPDQKQELLQWKDEWKQYGKQRKQLLDDIDAIIRINRDGFVQKVRPGGYMELDTIEHINYITRTQEAQKVADILVERINAYINSEWQTTCKRTVQQCITLLNERLNIDVSQDHQALVIRPSAERGTLLVAPSRSKQLFDEDWWERSKTVRLEMLNATAIAQVFNVIVPSLGGLVTVLTAAIGALRGWENASWRQIEKAKNTLKERLRSAIAAAYRYFDEKKPEEMRDSILEIFFGSLKRDMHKIVEQILIQKTAEIDDRIAGKLVDQQDTPWMALDHQGRALTKRLQSLKAARHVWEEGL